MKGIGENLCRIIAVLLLIATIDLVYVLLFGRGSVGLDVNKLADTDVVASPYVPLDAGKNVIWCGTMALAWNQAIATNGGPLIFTPPIPLTDELNRQEFTTSDLDSESYVAAAGRKLDGIDDKFRAALRAKFGEAANPPRLDEADPLPTNEDIAIYAYLLKNLLFGTPFNANENLKFEGKNVPSFGFGFESFASSEARDDQTSEVRLLDHQSDDDFIIELKTKSVGDQLILAKIIPGKTLQETIDTVLPKINSKVRWGIDHMDKLAVPKISFDLTKHFKEFEGKHFSGGRLNAVAENLVFELNEKGAELTVFTTISETLDVAAAPPKPLNLVFDKPFLIMLKRTSSPRPYFAMWVGNSSLLVAP